MNTFSKIRQDYKVPGKRGMLVRVDGKWGRIIGTSEGSMHYKVRFEADGRTGYCHPTWRVQYFDEQINQLYPKSEADHDPD